ncbi:hypothetical protein [Granulicella arctica]|uniref:hypothetical protein n=1 Tax=Granulicella arctica TaxID=940613 RepID=UPI0021DF9266|nr:hypothetical protein [Granulicella arctica]
MDLILFAALYAFLFVVLVLFFFQRIRYKRRRRRGAKHLGFYPTTTSLGNALHQLQRISQPRVQHVIMQQLDEEADGDDADSDLPIDPVRHLRRQAAKIRRGEMLDRLTAMRSPAR